MTFLNGKTSFTILIILFTGSLFSLSTEAKHITRTNQPVLLASAPSVSGTAVNSSDQVRLPPNQFDLAQQGECSQRVGPFVTQSTAWQRLQQAKNQGYSVSGVFPCYDGYGTRGYCFNVFFSC